MRSKLISMKSLIKFILINVIVFWGCNLYSQVFISQYIETNSGSSPKGLEIYNATASDIDFALTNLEITKGTNGAPCATRVTIDNGVLEAGKVWIIGTTNLVDYALNFGSDLSGASVYGMTFNGDDALQLVIGGVLMDVFGTCGFDPGSSWSGNGVSTANQNIQTKNTICSGTTSDWSDPSSRFETVSTDPVFNMTGFGNAPTGCSSGPTVPGAPTISSIVDGENQVSVYFYPGADGGSPITDFKYSTNGGSSFTAMGSTTSPYIITGLSNGTDYDIQILAVNAIGDGPASTSSTGSPYENVITLSGLGVAENEDFNTLASTGSSNILALGWFISETGSGADDTYIANTGSSNSGNTYSYGTDSDRALGGLYSGSVNPIWGAKIKNDMGVVLNNLSISYTGETWRVGSATRSDQINFEYSLDATSLSDGTWSNFDDLDYVNPGQATGNGSLQHSEAISNTITGLSIANGGFIWIRWTDQNSSGADDGMAIDDFSISASCPVGNTVTSHENIVRGNDITWTYDGTDFDSYEYQWNGTGGSWTPLTTNNPGSWGSCCPTIAIGTLYIRAKTSCSSTNDYSNIVSTYWGDCYAADISATMDGSSIIEGGSMSINETVAWTWPHDGSGVNNGASDEGGGTGHALGFYWDSDPVNPDDYTYAWNTNPQEWNDFSGSFFTSTDRKLYVKARSTGDNSCTNYSNSYYITLKKPEISVSSSSINLTGCAGSNGNSGSFDISGNYIKNSDGITIDAPTNFEISQDNSSFSSSINLLPSSGSVPSTTIYVRMSNSASGSPTGDITCSATASNSPTISLSGTLTAAPVITSSTSVTDNVTCGETTISVSTDAADGSGEWSNTGSGVFENPSFASSGFTSNTFDQNQTLTWTQTTGACSGSTCLITAKFNQPQESISGLDTDTWIWGGLTDAEFGTPANWYKWDGSKWLKESVSTPSTLSSIHILSNNDGGICISGSNNTTLVTGAGSLTIGSGASISLSGTVAISGDIINNGTINYGTSSISIDGSSNQTISGTSATFYDLTVSKSSGDLIVETPVTVLGTLYMTAGNIINSQPIVIGANSANTGNLNYSSGIITGQMSRYFDNAADSKFFPVGTSSILRDVSITFPSTPGIDQYLTIAYVSGAPILYGGESYQGLPLITEDGQLITNYDNQGHWVINPTGNDYNSDINLKEYSVSLHMNNIPDATDYTKARIIKSAGSNTASEHHVAWTPLTNQSVSGSNSDFTLTASSTGFSVFGGGSDTGDALPVELITFNGSCQNDLVEITWETASEYNSSHFDVESSRDGITWDVVKTIQAAGFSNELLKYNFKDNNVYGENNYYRLTQVDIDGESKTYDIINVICSQKAETYFSAYPNPSSGTFSITLNNPKDTGAAVLKLSDFKGSSVVQKEVKINDGVNVFLMNESLKPGIYIIEIQSNEAILSQKLIIK